MFADQGHSGGSAGLVISAFEKLARYSVLTPLTGEPSEWMRVTDTMWQNRRCSSVFKDSENGDAYDIDAIVYREPGGACFTKGGERHVVTFPYTPSVRYVDVDENEDATGENA